MNKTCKECLCSKCKNYDECMPCNDPVKTICFYKEFRKNIAKCEGFKQ
ncbi:MAG: hypothetical protein ACFE9S_07520 [Candidatus Hermodarchaeota archaeon]